MRTLVIILIVAANQCFGHNKCVENQNERGVDLNAGRAVAPYFDQPVEDQTLNGKAVVSLNAYERSNKLSGIEVYINDSLVGKTNDTGFFTITVMPGYKTIKLASPDFEKSVFDSLLVGSNEIHVGHFHMLRFAAIVFKPVIYIYPERTTEIDIQLNFNGRLDFTYPQYNNGWSVTADSTGKIWDDNRTYDYLFWDGKMTNLRKLVDYEKGFLVSGENVVTFLEEQLDLMGLNVSEVNDFITFWAPIMMKHDNMFVHFIVGKAYDDIATISVSPKPTSQFRVFMIFEPCTVEHNLTPKPQTFEPIKRSGFTLVEWGGGIFTPSNEIPN